MTNEEKGKGYLALPVKRFWIETGPDESCLVLELDGRASKVRLDFTKAVKALTPIYDSQTGVQPRTVKLLELQTLLTQTDSQLVLFVRVGIQKADEASCTLGLRPKNWNLDNVFAHAEHTDESVTPAGTKGP